MKNGDGVRQQSDLDDLGRRLEMSPPSVFKDLLKQYGYSDRMVRELWKWYDPPKE